jgi:hypothetical protein
MENTKNSEKCTKIEHIWYNKKKTWEKFFRFSLPIKYRNDEAKKAPQATAPLSTLLWIELQSRLYAVKKLVLLNLLRKHLL